MFAMKKVWITALENDEKQVKRVLNMVKRYGLDGNGHFWADDLKNMAWLGPKEAILDDETALWILLGSNKNLETASVRYGLALLALTVRAAKGYGFPVLFVDTKGDTISDTLPTPLRGMDIISIESSSLGAKMVARVNTPIQKIDLEYRIDIHAHPHFGVWFEIGPSSDNIWNGALLGVCGGEIDSHGVGNAGKLPQKTLLEYQMKGLKLTLGEREYTAWAVKNSIDGTHSYYVRAQGISKSIVFGSYTAEDEAQMNVINF